MSLLWVIAPVYNEAKTLESFIKDWIPVLRGATDGEYVFCLLNDGSTDDSPAILNTLAKDYPELHIIDKRNTGHGSTCMNGYRKALESGAEWILQIDSDGQCDPSFFPELWNARTDGKVHYGLRRDREDGLIRSFISGILASLLFLLSGRWLKDANVPYRLMHRNALWGALREIPHGFGLVNVLLALIQSTYPGIEWHPIRFRKRKGPQSSVRIGFFLRHAILFLRDYIGWISLGGKGRITEHAVRMITILLCLFSLYYLVTFPILAFIRAHLAAEFNWLEGVHMAQVRRVLEGNAIYVTPTLDYTPVLYSPLYIYISSLFAFIWGETYTLLRYISLAATIGSEIILGMLVWSMTRSRVATLIAPAIFGGFYAIVDFSFDLARVDSLAVFFTILYAYCMATADRRDFPGMICAAIASACAVLTKQTMLAPVLMLCAWGYMNRRGKTPVMALASFVTVMAGQIIPVLVSHGWYFFYLYRMPLAHPVQAELVRSFLSGIFVKNLSTGIFLSLCTLFYLWQKDERKSYFFFFVSWFIGMAIAGMAPLFKIGGTANNLIPFAAVIAFGSGLALGLVRKNEGAAKAVITLLLLCFCGQLFYLPKAALPIKSMVRNTKLKVAFFETLKGPVFAPCHPYITVLAGKNASAFWGAIFDVWLTSGDEKKLLWKQFEEDIKNKRFKTVVLEKTFFMQAHFPYNLLEKNYQNIDPPAMNGVPGPDSLGLAAYVPKR